MKVRAFLLDSVLCACACALALCAPWSAAQGDGAPAAVQEGAASVICTYSHRLPDDPIIYPGKPGIAMQHDFFGHTTTTADTTIQDLYAENASTCENAADNTAYWAPALKLPNGTVVAPTYQKTYYQNRAYPAPGRRVVVPIPKGLQMLAGDHRGTMPGGAIEFLCTGRGYSQTIPTDCVPDPVTGTQLNIAIAFPNCWDGKHLSPFRGGPNNMAYAKADGVCPDEYPVPLPLLSFQAVYMVGNVTDLTGTQLSMDPTLDDKGNVVSLNWGSLYSAHADFFNGWTQDAMRFMVEYCLNKGRMCGSTVAYSYTEALADATVRGGVAENENFGGNSQLFAQQASDTVAESKIYLQFKIPKGAVDLPIAFRPEYRLMLWGGSTATPATIIQAHRAADSWQEHTITAHNAPACSGPSATLYLDSAQSYRYFNVTQLVNDAIAAGADTISFCIRGAPQGYGYQFTSKETNDKPVLYLYAVNPLPY